MNKTRLRVWRTERGQRAKPIRVQRGVGLNRSLPSHWTLLAKMYRTDKEATHG